MGQKPERQLELPIVSEAGVVIALEFVFSEPVHNIEQLVANVSEAILLKTQSAPGLVPLGEKAVTQEYTVLAKGIRKRVDLRRL